MLVNGSIQPPTLTFDIHMNFIDSPRITSGTQIRTAAFVQQRAVSLDPAVDGGIVNSQATFLGQFFYIPVAEAVAVVPTHTAQDNYREIMTPL